MTLAALTFAGLVNVLAGLQTADCLTTKALVNQENIPGHQTVEINPVTRAVGADRSLPVCLGSAAIVNFAIRATHQTWLAKTALVFEVAAVGSNVHVLMSFSTK